MILMQDGATAHWSADTREALNVAGFKVLEGWPSGSPDLNPIEKVWARLEQCVADRGPYGREELQQFVYDEFLKLSDEFIEKLVLSFKGGLQECVKNSGNSLKN